MESILRTLESKIRSCCLTRLGLEQVFHSTLSILISFVFTIEIHCVFTSLKINPLINFQSSTIAKESQASPSPLMEIFSRLQPKANWMSWTCTLTGAALRKTVSKGVPSTHCAFQAIANALFVMVLITASS